MLRGSGGKAIAACGRASDLSSRVVRPETARTSARCGVLGGRLLTRRAPCGVGNEVGVREAIAYRSWRAPCSCGSMRLKMPPRVHLAQRPAAHRAFPAPAPATPPAAPKPYHRSRIGIGPLNTTESRGGLSFFCDGCATPGAADLSSSIFAIVSTPEYGRNAGVRNERPNAGTPRGSSSIAS